MASLVVVEICKQDLMVVETCQLVQDGMVLVKDGMALLLLVVTCKLV